jgi:hypothetical protein
MLVFLKPVDRRRDAVGPTLLAEMSCNLVFDLMSVTQLICNLRYLNTELDVLYVYQPIVLP